MDNPAAHEDSFYEQFFSDVLLAPVPEPTDEVIKIANELEKEAAVTDKKFEDEKKLIKDFKANSTSATFTPLFQSFKPLIYKAAMPNMINSPIPQAAHMALATQAFYDAAKTWDHKKGASFRTHIYGAVNDKGKRLNYKYQNLGYIPENRAAKYGPIHNAMAILKDSLGREPSTFEIADELSIPPGQVEKLLKEIRKDRILDDSTISQNTFFRTDRARALAQDLQYELIPQHQVVIEHMFGLNGKKELLTATGMADIPAIAKATKLKESQVRSAKKIIEKKAKRYLGLSQPTEEDVISEEGDFA